MKRWQAIAAVVIALILVIFLVSPAFAQGFEDLPPAMATVISKTGVFVNQVLGHWVSGNDITPQGSILVEAIVKTAVNTVHFLAEIVTWF